MVKYGKHCWYQIGYVDVHINFFWMNSQFSNYFKSLWYKSKKMRLKFCKISSSVKRKHREKSNIPFESKNSWRVIQIKKTIKYYFMNED